MRSMITLALAATVFAAGSAAAATSSAFASFNGTNGNGGFTYGYTDGTTLTAFDTSNTGSACALAGATCLYSAANGNIPFASVGGSYPTVNVPADAVVVHPGNSALLSDYVSFTTPAVGTYHYSIAVQSRGIDTTDGIGYRTFTSVGGVVTLGTRGVISTYLGATTLAGSTTLAPGSQFGVIIDRNSIYYGDSTGINFTVNAVPEPASWALMIAGFGLVGVAARRRSAAVAA